MFNKISVLHQLRKLTILPAGEQPNNDCLNFCINTSPVTQCLVLGLLPSGKECDLLFSLIHQQMALRSLHQFGATVCGLFPRYSFVSRILNFC
jgi:hypothetical protein